MSRVQANPFSGTFGAIAILLTIGATFTSAFGDDLTVFSQSVYEFTSTESTITQSGGFAGVDWTYALEGRFQLSINPNADTAVFAAVDANAVRTDDPSQTLDPNEVFNLTGLTGMLTLSGAYVFRSHTADGSGVELTLALEDGSACLVGQTTPPPDSADFFVFSLDAAATRKYGGGAGEPNDPYQIYTAEHLMAMDDDSQDLDKHFKLMANIDMGQYRNHEFNEVGDYSEPFTGGFDGGGRTISNLIVECGLFGCVGKVGGQYPTIKNLRLLAPCVSSDINLPAGGLVGEMRMGHVVNCRVEGGSIGGWSWVGGLVGSAYGDTKIEQCFSSGGVGGTDFIGGLVGCSQAEILNCHTSAIVGGQTAVGGLVGKNAGGRSSAPGTIVNCYAIGFVDGIGTVGGLVGEVSENVYNSFWDVETSGQNSSAGGEGKTTAEMQTAATFTGAGWDFVDETSNGTDDIWWIQEGQDYPRLWYEGPKYSGGTGEPNDPYQIATAADLIALGANSEDYGKHFILTADIDMDPNFQEGGVFIHALIAFDPVSPIQDWRTPFAGVFDGNGHVIRNLHVVHHNLSSAFGGGLFGHIDASGRVYNLWLEDVMISGQSFYVAGLAGENHGSITNCHVTGTISGWAGGALVAVNGPEEDSTGQSLQGSLSNCSADVNIVPVDDECGGSTGGLVGTNNWGTIRNCRSSGSIMAETYVGGLVGTNHMGVIADCYSDAAVAGDTVIGGLLGLNEGQGTVTGCYAKGAVAGIEVVGGLAGGNVGAILDCYAQSSVTGTSLVGGLAGANTMGSAPGSAGIVRRCYSTGLVSGANDIGGLLGWSGSVEVTDSFWDIQSSGQTFSAGGEGKTTAEMQTAATFLDAGWDFLGETDNGAEDIWWMPEWDYPRLWWEVEDQ